MLKSYRKVCIFSIVRLQRLMSTINSRISDPLFSALEYQNLSGKYQRVYVDNVRQNKQRFHKLLLNRHVLSTDLTLSNSFRVSDNTNDRLEIGTPFALEIQTWEENELMKAWSVGSGFKPPVLWVRSPEFRFLVLLQTINWVGNDF